MKVNNPESILNLQTCLEQILAELRLALAAVSNESGAELIKAIVEAERIFIAGAGRSGLAVKGFAMRLMHLGLAVHVVGEITTPGISRGDLLLIGSGSGASDSLLVVAEKARSVGARVALLTISAASPLGQKSDIILTIPAVTPKLEGGTGAKSSQPLGSLFEQALSLTLDALVMGLMSRLGVDSQAMFIRHANLE
ncbi:MAG: 6-phospho-3-hexuloisomerase [Chloroflexota bacterium]